ncbi:hypothetical protein B0H14DRAFT_2641632 [Mycena olivaceomarginata]|nr:hypothetical protein B0H14DRAFT_2641632 [Mycena olivaceomarginata]
MFVFRSVSLWAGLHSSAHAAVDVRQYGMSQCRLFFEMLDQSVESAIKGTTCPKVPGSHRYHWSEPLATAEFERKRAKIIVACSALTTAILAITNQMFQTWKIYLFKRNKTLVVFLSVTSLAACGLGATAAIKSWLIFEFVKIATLQPIVEANLALQVTTIHCAGNHLRISLLAENEYACAVCPANRPNLYPYHNGSSCLPRTVATHPTNHGDLIGTGGGCGIDLIANMETRGHNMKVIEPGNVFLTDQAQ